MNDEAAIRVEGLVKYFDGRCVLDGVSFEVERGCIYGLLGRNGSGKTTIIRTLLGLERPTRGGSGLLGVDSQRLGAGDRGRIGYVAEGHELIGRLKVGQLIGLCKGVARRWNGELFGRLMEVFRLPRERKVKQLSQGMRAQLNLALALAVDPEVLVLDDPTLGLDTVVRRQFLELAIDLIQRQGRTILFSSHILSDVERIADRVGILVGGQLVVDCGLEALKRRVKKLRLTFAEEAPEELALTDVVACRREGREMLITLANWDEHKRMVLEAYGPETWSEVGLTLEDIFVEATHPQGEVLVGEKEIYE